jgi:hypothetical protein
MYSDCPERDADRHQAKQDDFEARFEAAWNEHIYEVRTVPLQEARELAESFAKEWNHQPESTDLLKLLQELHDMIGEDE